PGGPRSGLIADVERSQTRPGTLGDAAGTLRGDPPCGAVRMPASAGSYVHALRAFVFAGATLRGWDLADWGRDGGFLRSAERARPGPGRRGAGRGVIHGVPRARPRRRSCRR